MTCWLLIFVASSSGARTPATNASAGIPFPALAHGTAVVGHGIRGEPLPGRALQEAESRRGCSVYLPTDTRLDFSYAEILNNNLGGKQSSDLPNDVELGPVGDDPKTGRSLNLRIVNTTTYIPFNVVRNGFTGVGIFQFNLAAPYWGAGIELAHVTLRFSLIYNDTGEPATLERFRFSFFDFDEGSEARGRECISSSGYRDVILYSDVEDGETQLVDGVDAIDSSFTSFCSTQWGHGSDNPRSPYNLTGFQKSKALQLTFENTSDWDIRFSIGCCQARHAF